jgi:hypothetical protein
MSTKATISIIDQDGVNGHIYSELSEEDNEGNIPVYVDISTEYGHMKLLVRKAEDD